MYYGQSIYSITENMYYSHLSFVLLLQPERNCFTSYNERKGLRSLSLCAIVLWSSSRAPTCNGQRSSELFCVHYTSQQGSSDCECSLGRRSIVWKRRGGWWFVSEDSLTSRSFFYAYKQSTIIARNSVRTVFTVVSLNLWLMTNSRVWVCCGHFCLHWHVF
jgi:hypothetical protein